MGERDGRRRPAAPDQLRTLPRAKGDGKRFTNKLYADSARSSVADSPDTTKEEHGKVARLLLKAKKQYQAGQRAEDRLRRDMQDDRRFSLGRLGDESFQWPDHVYRQRKQERRATLQTNRMPAFVALARNAVLGANLRPHVQPVDDKADVKTAEVLGALIRNTEHLSQVEAVYTSAIDSMAENGRGYLQICTEWADDTSWNQRPRLKRVLNPFRILVDPSAQEPDQRDAEYAFLETDYDADTWKEEFGGADKPLPTAAGTDWTGTEAQYRSNWFPSNKKVRVMDWYCAEYDKVTLYEIHNGHLYRHVQCSKLDLRVCQDACHALLEELTSDG